MDRYALITGASSGIGKESGRILASKGYNLVIVARREERLKELALEINGQFEQKVLVLQKDLSVLTSAQEIFDELRSKGIQVEVLINNAGYALYPDFLSHGLEDLNKMLNVNITTLTNLTWLFAQEMVKNGCGYILQLSSVGAFQPSPNYAAYSASKAYVMLLGEALDHELSGKNVSVTTMYPGATKTEFHQTAEHEPSRLVTMTYMSAHTVAKAGIDAMFARRRSITPGLLNKLMVFFVQLLPRKSATAIADRLMRT